MVNIKITDFFDGYTGNFFYTKIFYGIFLNTVRFDSADTSNQRLASYSYQTVISAGKSEEKTIEQIIKVVKIALGEVEKYIKTKHEKEKMVIDSYKSFLNAGGYSLESSPLIKSTDK